jgi:hypothetical protein
MFSLSLPLKYYARRKLQTRANAILEHVARCNAAVTALPPMLSTIDILHALGLPPGVSVNKLPSDLMRYKHARPAAAAGFILFHPRAADVVLPRIATRWGVYVAVGCLFVSGEQGIFHIGKRGVHVPVLLLKDGRHFMEFNWLKQFPNGGHVRREVLYLPEEFIREQKDYVPCAQT